MCSCGDAQLNPNSKQRASIILVLFPLYVFVEFSRNVSVSQLFVGNVNFFTEDFKRPQVAKKYMIQEGFPIF